MILCVFHLFEDRLVLDQQLQLYCSYWLLLFCIFTHTKTDVIPCCILKRSSGPSPQPRWTTGLWPACTGRLRLCSMCSNHFVFNLCYLCSNHSLLKSGSNSQTKHYVKKNTMIPVYIVYMGRSSSSEEFFLRKSAKSVNGGASSVSLAAWKSGSSYLLKKFKFCFFFFSFLSFSHPHISSCTLRVSQGL